MSAKNNPRVALYGARRDSQRSEERQSQPAGGSDSVGDKVPLNKPIIIGVTGGIAGGKSTLSRMIVGRGIIHVDADMLVHSLLQHDRSTVEAVAAAFPKAVSNQQVDRSAIAVHIAKQPDSLATLEAILHPRVRALEEKAILYATRNRLRAVILDVPLMFETAADELCDVVIMAHASASHRRRRAFKRPGMTEAKWQRLIARQWPDADKKHLADIVIETSMGKAAMRRQIHALMNEWGLR